MKPTKAYYFYIIFAVIVCFETLIASWLKINWIHYISKPLVVISLIIFFLLNSKHLKSNIKTLTLFALIFSLFGDVLLLFVNKSQHFFILGLLAFLIAHVLYSLVFLKQRNKRKKPYGFIGLLLLYAIGLFWFLKSGLQELLIPVILYMLVILLMATSAFLRQEINNAKGYYLVFFGALLFMISDSLLAINKFYATIPNETFWIMITYALAQFFIVLGILKQKS